MGVEFSESRPSMMILRQRVRIFCVVAELKSFTLAARELGISQSMVSRKVSELEAELGVRLFDHEVRPIELTSSGEALHQLISQWDEGTKNGPDRSALLGHNFVYQETKPHGFYSSYFHQRISS